MRRSKSRKLFACLAMSAAVQNVYAVNIIRNNVAASLNTTAAWATGTVPGSGDIATYNSSSVGGTQTLGGDLSFKGITISGATPSGLVMDNASLVTLSLGSAGIDCAGGTLSNRAISFNANVAVNLAADQTWQMPSPNATNGSIVVNSVISGTGALTVNRPNTTFNSLTLSGANTFTGNFTAGSYARILIGAGSSVTGTTINSSPLGLGTVTLGGTATMTLATLGGTARDIAFNQLNIAGDLNIDDTATNTGRLRIAGSIDLGGATRTLTLNAGTAAGGSGNVKFGFVNLGTIVSSVSNGTLALTSTVSSPNKSYVHFATANVVAFNNNAGLTIGNNVSTTFGSSFVFANNANTKIPNLTILAGGTLDMSDQATASRGVNVASLSGAGLVTNGVTSAGTANLNIDGTSATATNNTTFSGIISDGAVGNVALSKSGSTTQTLSGANTYTGSTTVSGGKLILDATGTINNTSQLNLSGSGKFDVSAKVGGYNFPHPVFGAGTITGTLITNSTVTPSGVGTVSLGTLTTGNFTLNGSAIFDIDTTNVTSDKINAGTNTLTLNSATSTLTVTDVGAAPTIGQVFDLFDGTIANTFQTITLPTLPGTMSWKTFGSSLLDYSTGRIEIVSNGPVQATWNVNASGNWSTNSNWTPGSPNGLGTSATFGSVITTAQTVTVDAAQTVSALTFNNANKYTVAGTSTLTIDAASSATIDVTNGSHDITAPLAIGQNTTVSVANSADKLTVTNLQPTAKSITKSGAGVLEVSSISANGLTVNAGKVVLATSSAPITAASELNSLTITGTGQLDVKNNAVYVHSTDTTDAGRSAIWLQVSAGMNNFDNNGQVTWDGAGIVSSTARSSNLGLGVDAYTIGVVSNHDLARLAADGGAAIAYDSGNPWLGTISNIGADDILIRMTYAGDTNLDGAITIDDYNNIDATYSGLLATNYGWVSGDFDFSGTITIDDYNAIDTGYLYQGGQLTESMRAQRLAMFGAEYVSHLEQTAAAFASVPEPASIGFATVIGLASLARRVRRK